MRFGRGGHGEVPRPGRTVEEDSSIDVSGKEICLHAKCRMRDLEKRPGTFLAVFWEKIENNEKSGA